MGEGGESCRFFHDGKRHGAESLRGLRGEDEGRECQDCVGSGRRWVRSNGDLWSLGFTRVARGELWWF